MIRFMKIAMIGHKRIPSREGGVEIVVEELAVRMAAAGHSVTAYNRAGEHVSGAEHGTGEKQKSYKGVRLINVPTFRNKSLNALVYSFFATAHALFSGYDVIHYHAEGPSAMLWIPKLFGRRAVSTVHGLDWQRGKWGGFASRYLKFGEKVLARRADEVIVLSENVQHYFREAYRRETVFIPNGVNRPEKLPPRLITEKYGLRGGDYILFLARLVPEKGLHYLLEAFRDTDTGLKLVIAGGGSHSDSYVAEVTELAGRDPRVIMTGFVQGDTLTELYSNCALYVLPSDVEGMPLTLLEAMSFGCRCLTSDIPENISVTGQFAASFQKSDIAHLAEKLRALGAGELPFPPPEEITEYVLGRFNWDDVARRTLEVYAAHMR
jgi:glycosyltransferase involved in cell wall biosynthesis